MSDKPRAFARDPEPVDHVIVNKKVLHVVRDIANQIYVAHRCPNANLIFLEAFKQYLERKGVKANFSVLMEEKKYE